MIISTKQKYEYFAGEEGRVPLLHGATPPMHNCIKIDLTEADALIKTATNVHDKYPKEYAKTAVIIRFFIFSRIKSLWLLGYSPWYLFLIRCYLTICRLFLIFIMISKVKWETVSFFFEFLVLLTENPKNPTAHLSFRSFRFFILWKKDSLISTLTFIIICAWAITDVEETLSSKRSIKYSSM